MKYLLLICSLLFMPFSIIAQEEEEEEIEKPEKAWKKDTSFHKSRLAIKTDLFLQFQFTGVDVEVCLPLTKHVYVNVDLIRSTDKFFPKLAATRTYPSWTAIGELRYFFPQHSTFDGAFVGPYYRYKKGVKRFNNYYPHYDDYYDVSSHTVGIVTGFSFQPRWCKHLVIEAHTGMGIAVELDIIRQNPQLPTNVPDHPRHTITTNERINPRAGFCVGYAF